MKNYDSTQIMLGIPEVDRRSAETEGMTVGECRDWYTLHYPEIAVVFFSEDDDE